MLPLCDSEFSGWARAAIQIELGVSSRRSSPTYNAISAVATVTNTSRVVTRVTKVEWELRVLSPYADAAVEDKVKEYEAFYYVSGDPVEFPWNVNYALYQDNARIYLEPGESNTVSMALAIPGLDQGSRCKAIPPSTTQQEKSAGRRVGRQTYP